MMSIGDIDTLVGVGVVSGAEADQESVGGGDPLGQACDRRLCYELHDFMIRMMQVYGEKSRTTVMFFLPPVQFC
jgi:hypothetical protein